MRTVMNLTPEIMEEFRDKLQRLGGCFICEDAGVIKLFCLEDTKYSKYLSVHQILNAIALLNGKCSDDYGDLWPKYKDSTGSVSSVYSTILNAHKNRSSDYELFELCCEQLKEELPATCSHEELEAKLAALIQSEQE